MTGAPPPQPQTAVPPQAVPVAIQSLAPAAPAATTAAVHANPGIMLKIGIAAVACVMIAVSVAVTLVVTQDTISSWDVLSAGNSATELSSDMSNIDSAAKSLETASTLGDFSTISSTMTSHISDADDQYQLLAISPVLKNGQVRSDFAALQRQWTAYDGFVRSTASDYKTLGPLLVELNNDQQSALSASKSSSSNLGTELVQYATLVNAVGQQGTSLSMLSEPDTQLVANLETYVKSSDESIAKAQSDLSGGRGVNVVSADITGIATAAATFSNQQDSWATSSYALLQQKEPSSQMATLIASIKNLSKSVSQQ